MLWLKFAPRSSIVALVVVLAANGCSSVSGPSSTDHIGATARNGRLEIRNNSDQPTFVFLIGREAAAYTDWIACADPGACAPIPAGGRQLLPYPSSQIGADEHEALVFWWHSVRDRGGSFRPDSIRALIVPL